MSDDSKGFWASIPGVLTGAAAVITAVTGLYLAVNDNFSSDKPEVPAEPDTTHPLPSPTPAIAPIVKPMGTAEIIEDEKDVHDKLPDSGMHDLVDCKLFPTVNSVGSLMSWSDHYQQEIIAANNSNNIQQSERACKKAIDYRAMAHCSSPNDIKVRQALFETLTLCQTAGIEWTDIK